MRHGRRINYSQAEWLEPTETTGVDWACIWLVQNADSPTTYSAVRYCRECTMGDPEGIYRDRPAGRRWGNHFGSNYVLRYNSQEGCWSYTGRGVTLRFQTESELFFPHDGCAYSYNQAGREIAGKLVYGCFTWSHKYELLWNEVVLALKEQADTGSVEASPNLEPSQPPGPPPPPQLV